ncbi:MAG: protein phosphatase 2C domain-containing protein [Muribaculaceae bacterium]|nr:protein phosphatase 2C domain-containing protein [Muribaculaceae bacterium]
MIKIRQPYCFSEIGKKDNQEDYLFPQDANTGTRTFILCDGMGGHDNGEVASMTVAKALGECLSSCSNIDIPTFEMALSKTYDKLDEMVSDSNKKPGTTMACLCLNDNNYLVAHIGDSRIYHIRPSLYNKETKRGSILYQSSDHSLVNDLLKAGEIDEEEARNFPQKNVITRAMQPQLEKRYKADIFMFDDIKEGDYFFLCCDGILEQLSNETLCEVLADNKLNDSQKISKIKSICDVNTQDNYSCWLIPIDKVIIKENKPISSVILANSENENPNKNSNSPFYLAKPNIRQNKMRRFSPIIYWILTILATLILLWGIYVAYSFFKTPEKIEQEIRIEKINQDPKAEKMFN